LQGKKLCALTGKTPAKLKNALYFAPALQAVFPPKPEAFPRFSLANRAFSRQKPSVLSGLLPCGALRPAFPPVFSSGRGIRTCGSALPCWVGMSVSWITPLYKTLSKRARHPSGAYCYLYTMPAPV
jgi:hypothetical protein